MKTYKKRSLMTVGLWMALSLVIVSCGSDDDDDDPVPVTGTPTQEQDQQQGEFRAVLTPENANVSTANGTAVVKIQGDEFETEVEVDDARNTTHAQHIHTGTRCPTPADDTNGDGVVDAAEASAVYGGVLLPLDSDLTSSTPNASPAGVNFNYRETASFAQILSNLNLQTMNVEGKVVNVHGIPASVTLPATAQGGNAAFPIACGVLTRVSAEASDDSNRGSGSSGNGADDGSATGTTTPSGTGTGSTSGTGSTTGTPDVTP